LARFQFARFFRRFDHAQRQPVLDRAQGIERFDFNKQIYPLRGQRINSDHGRIADCLKDVVEFASHMKSPQVHRVCRFKQAQRAI